MMAKVSLDYYGDRRSFAGQLDLLDPVRTAPGVNSAAASEQETEVVAGDGPRPPDAGLRQRYPALDKALALTRGADWTTVVRRLAADTGLLVVSDWHGAVPSATPWQKSPYDRRTVTMDLSAPLWRLLPTVERAFEVTWRLDETSLSFRWTQWYLGESPRAAGPTVASAGASPAKGDTSEPPAGAAAPPH